MFSPATIAVSEGASRSTQDGSSAAPHLLEDDGPMLGHQMQCHFELTQQLACLGGAPLRVLELEDALLLPFDAVARLNNQPIDAGQMAVAIALPRQASAPGADRAAEATNEQLIVGL